MRSAQTSARLTRLSRCHGSEAPPIAYAHTGFVATQRP